MKSLQLQSIPTKLSIKHSSSNLSCPTSPPEVEARCPSSPRIRSLITFCRRFISGVHGKNCRSEEIGMAVQKFIVRIPTQAGRGFRLISAMVPI